MKRDNTMRPQDLTHTQPISLDVLKEKYLKPGEDGIEDLYRRVARALASVEKEDVRADWEQRFLANLHAGAIGAGRIMSAAGTDIQATLINCFVQPVGDCIQGVDAEGYPGIYEALREAAETMRRGGGVGYDFSRIRPKGAEVKGTHSMASGPCSYINVFDQSCSTVESAGARRGAQMGVLRIDHPDVLEFITAKRTPGRWNNFNVSVGVSDAFMEALGNDQPWELVHKARPGAPLIAKGAYQRADGQWVYQTIAARELWDTVMKSAYDFAEPGILFLDQIRNDNNLRYCESIEATNPCVTADTWVMTEDGARQVSDLIGCDFKAVVDGRSYALESEGFFATGVKPVLRLRTREGHSLRLTGDHRVRRVARKTRYSLELDWTPAERLQPGDEIVLNNHHNLQGWGGEGSQAEGYLLGLLIGDGTLKADKAVLSVWAPELRAVGSDTVAYARTGAAGIVQAAEAAAATLSHRADFKGFQRPMQARGEARLASTALRDLAFALGMAPGHKTITPAMEQQSSDFTEGLLCGLFDADGSVQGSQDKGVSVRLSQSDASLLATVQRMLLRLGIVSTLYTERRPAAVASLPDGRGGRADYATQAQHELVVSGDNLRVYAERIGFEDSDKAERLAQALGSYKRSLNRERFTATVESLVPDGEEMVFDVTVADVHAFDANGLVVHNCGEQPLPPYGCCDLGPVILTRFVRNPFGFGGLPAFDFDAFEQAVTTQVRALDNVLDVTFWPLPQQREESAAKRRIGVGFTGMGNTLAMLCVRYDRDEGRAMAAQIAERMRDAAYAASVALAQEKGAFPKLVVDDYLAAGTFASRLPAALQKQIRKHGIRNSHLLSIAPTGTVSLAFADNASNGIEPPFSWMYRRKKREADGSTSEYAVEDHAWRLYRELGGDVNQLPEYFVNALAMSAGDHIAMMQAVQPFVDTAISKTVNVEADYPYEDFKGLYQQAWRAHLKGLATYRPNSILGSVLDTGSAASDAAAAAALAAPAPVDPMRTVIESRPKGALSAVADKVEYWTQEGHKTLYIVVSFLPVPAADGVGTVERAIEFFMPVGQSGESQQWITSTMRMLSLAARGGFLERALGDMRKVAWDRGPVRLGTYQKADGTHVPMWHDSEVAAIAFALQNIIARRAQQGVAAVMPEPVAASVGTFAGVMAGKKCPECGAHAMIRKDGCDYCTQCGHLGTCG
ncbi:MAG: ribonucleoside reductase [Hydrogenophaga sp.]|uniref:LAGLIDADG family homing endonuclease n=1 Tax=Hydrogenophaga sp. TaxID=1904254 RepID=UPI001BBE2325|nr:LAGLIDADG family homing endonuclease [Hydrogenophaga sp.]MBS3910956.1 ribonucleoside reductase [Hydrogenophaga sp.]MDO9149474.1 LAGLIDADG family homing endonuclease [Hydrogenophaga sp.]MDO9606837.1 LAGLIDADG family homing endonuclease [Hydrogenophaga sp.]